MGFRQSLIKRLSQSQKTRIKALQLILRGQTNDIDLAFGLKQECKLSNKILIGTHHKTGTVWLESIFREICRSHNLKFYTGEQDSLPAQFDVFLQDFLEEKRSIYHDFYRCVQVFLSWDL